MADIRIKDLPLATGPTAPAPADVVALDGTTTRKAPLSSLAEVIRPVATQAEAEAGTNAVKAMTPLTTKQSIASEVEVSIASASQGALAATSIQPPDIQPIGSYDGTPIPKSFNVLSSFIDIHSEFGITGNGIADDTAGFQALATYAATDNSKRFAARQGATYRVDTATNMVFPAGSRFEFRNSRFIRGASLAGSDRIFSFSEDSAPDDALHIELEPGVVYQRLVRFTDGCFIPDIVLDAATRNQSVISPNDQAFAWIGATGTESMRGAGFGNIRASNVDNLTQFYRPAAGAGDPTPARDLSIGDARTKNCGMVVWLRNCMDWSVGDLLNVGAPIGGATATEAYVLLMEGVQNGYVEASRGVDTLTHVCRNSGPRTANEISDKGIQIGLVSSIRGHRTAYKTQVGLAGQRVTQLQIGMIRAEDCGYDDNASLVPESNEEVMRLDCVDGAQVAQIIARNSARPYSCYDGVVVADATDVTIGNIDIENPYRHHLSFLSYTQGGLPPGPLSTIRVSRIRGLREASGNQDANVLIDCVGQPMNKIEIDNFEFSGGTDVFKILADNVPSRCLFRGMATGYSGRPFSYVNGSNWRARQNIIFEDTGRGTPTGLALNSYMTHVPRGSGPFAAAGLTLGHWRLSNGTGATNSISRITGPSSDSALEWDRTVAGSASSFMESRIGNPKNYAGRWMSLVFTASSPAGANRIAAYLSVNYGTGGSSTFNAAAIAVETTTTPQEYCIPFFIQADTALTYGAGNRLAIVLQRFSNDPNGKIVIERVDLYQTPFGPSFVEKGSIDYVVSAGTAEL